MLAVIFFFHLTNHKQVEISLECMIMKHIFMPVPGQRKYDFIRELFDGIEKISFL